MKATKRRAEEANLEDNEELMAAEQKRFKDVVQKRMKLEVDPTSKRQARIEREKDNCKTRGVIYIGHLPHGFYEDELKKYFSQFGVVTRVRVSRSRKTGGSRGYAFVEFLHDTVAKVAAETMDGYLMFERLLKVAVVPKEKVHPDMFAPRFPFPLNREITRTFLNMERTDTRDERNKRLRMDRLQKQMGKLKSLGISYSVQPIGANIGEVKVAASKKPTETLRQNNKKENKPASDDEEEDSESEVEAHTVFVDSDDNEIEFKTPPHGVKKPKPKNRESLPAHLQHLMESPAASASKKKKLHKSMNAGDEAETPLKKKNKKSLKGLEESFAVTPKPEESQKMKKAKSNTAFEQTPSKVVASTPMGKSSKVSAQSKGFEVAGSQPNKGGGKFEKKNKSSMSISFGVADAPKPKGMATPKTDLKQKKKLQRKSSVL